MSDRPCPLTVAVDGFPLRNHHFPKLGVTFVVAQPSKAFTITVTNIHSERVGAEVFVDGSRTGCREIIKPGRSRVIQGWWMPGGYAVQQFVFSRPPTVEEESSEGADLEALATIKVLFWPVKPLQSQKRPAGASHSQHAVPEGKKALSLGVTATVGAMMHADWRPARHTCDKSRGPLGSAVLHYGVPDLLRLSADPRLKKVGAELVQHLGSASGADDANTAGTRSATSSSALSTSAPASASFDRSVQHDEQLKAAASGRTRQKRTRRYPPSMPATTTIEIESDREDEADRSTDVPGKEPKRDDLSRAIAASQAGSSRIEVDLCDSDSD